MKKRPSVWWTMFAVSLLLTAPAVLAQQPDKGDDKPAESTEAENGDDEKKKDKKGPKPYDDVISSVMTSS